MPGSAVRLLHVLYAEDDDNDVFFMRRVFKGLDLLERLAVVADGRSAVTYLQGGGVFGDRSVHPLPDLILLDVKMPGLTGIEVLRWVRSRSEFDTVPVVMLTSSTQERDLADSAEAGANGYLVKPPHARGLAELIPLVLAAVAQPGGRGQRLAISSNLLPVAKPA